MGGCLSRPTPTEGAPALVEGRVTCARSGFWEVDTADGPRLCRLRGRLKQGRREGDLAVIGDRVRVEPSGARDGVIVEVLPRTTRFSRLAPGARRAIEDVLVANLDLVLVCVAASVPAPNPRLVDRFLAIAEWNRIEAAVVVTKLDEGVPAPLAQASEAWRRAGYDVLGTSARSGEGLDALRLRLSGRLSALLGPSGAGKSSLLNALAPGLDAAVGEVSDAVQKGRHTTRVATLHALPSGGHLADTPGLRELEPFDLPAEALSGCFPDLAALAPRCRFANCTHDHEPGCGVRPAVAEGELDAGRFESYLRQLRGEPG